MLRGSKVVKEKRRTLMTEQEKKKKYRGLHISNLSAKKTTARPSCVYTLSPAARLQSSMHSWPDVELPLRYVYTAKECFELLFITLLRFPFFKQKKCCPSKSEVKKKKKKNLSTSWSLGKVPR